MSRSLTPQELSFMAKEMLNTNGVDLRNIQFCFKPHEGNWIDMQSEEENALRARYKELGFLFDRLYDVYKRMEYYAEYALMVFNIIEEKLDKYVEYNSCEYKNDIVWLWYTGRLSPSFYYNDNNNELFACYIEEQIMNFVRKN